MDLGLNGKVVLVTGADRGIGAAAIDSSSSTTGTGSLGPNSNASGGDITIAPPNPVMPRITPASAPMMTASASVSGAKEFTVYDYGLGGDQRRVVGPK